MVQAFRIAEHKDVRLPIMICQDGFITSHAVENIELLDDADVKNFVGEYEPENYLLNPKQPMAVGPYAITDYYMEAKRNQAEALKNSVEVVKAVAKEFAGISGREYGLFEEYCMEDAERAVVIIGSAAGTTKDTIDALREKNSQQAIVINNAQQTAAFGQMIAQATTPIAQAVAGLQGDIAGIKCKLPETVTLPFSCATAVPTQAVFNPFCAFGLGSGFNNSLWG